MKQPGAGTEDPAEINELFKGFKSGVGTKSEGSGDYGGWNQKVEVRSQRLRWGAWKLRSGEHGGKGVRGLAFLASGQMPCLCSCFFSAPSFDYADMPSPLGESENTITVLLRPAQGRGAPIRWECLRIEGGRQPSPLLWPTLW